MIRQPQFWRRDPSAIEARALAPIAAIWGSIAGRRMNRAAWRAPVPTICVGNFVAGGAGKTPVVIAVCELLRAAGRRPAVVARGYRSSLSGRTPIAVDRRRHGPAEVGDEALLLERSAPTVIGANRRAACLLAYENGADVIVMDDGFQSATVTADETLIVIDGADGVGNGRVLPAGPLRAPLAAQWPHVSAALVLGEGAPGDRLEKQARSLGKPTFRAALAPDPAVVQNLAGRRILAFAGIGRPEKFYATLASIGADIRARRSFPDHFRYRPADIDLLLRLASSCGAECLVTTAKDLVRVTGPSKIAQEIPPILALPVAVSFAEPTAFVGWINRIGPLPGRPPN